MQHDHLSPVGNLANSIVNSPSRKATTTHGSTAKPADTATSRPTQNTNTETSKRASAIGSGTHPNSRAAAPSPANQRLATNSSSPENSLLERSRSVYKLVSRLLSHYWTDNDHLATRQAQIEDWIEDLVDFKIEDVEAACSEWRRTQIHRPAPAQIIALVRQCRQAQPAADYHQVTDAKMQEKANQRRMVAPLWDLVRRSLAGEPVDELLAERKQICPD